MTQYYNQILSDECNDYSVVVEDDGRVCYAYLLMNNRIIGDVWLYNQVDPPEAYKWDNPDEMPFLNTLDFIDGGFNIAPITDESEIGIEFYYMGNCQLDKAKIFIQGEYIAMLKIGSKPGWAINVKKDGPLAKRLMRDFPPDSEPADGAVLPDPAGGRRF